MLLNEIFSKVTYSVKAQCQDLCCKDSNLDVGKNCFPGIKHTIVFIDNFPFCKRIDWYCVVGRQAGQLLFVDTGHPALTGGRILEYARQKADMRWDQVQVFITHFHLDHAGNLPFCLFTGARRAYFQFPVPFQREFPKEIFQWMNIPQSVRDDRESSVYIETLLAKNWSKGIPVERCFEVGVGDAIDIAGYHLACLPTPGHSPKHTCLVDKNRGVMFAGDHLIYAHPGVGQLLPNQHLLFRYCESLPLLRSFKLKAVLMSHHGPLFGRDEVDGFLRKTEEGYKDLLESMDYFVGQHNRVGIYQMAQELALKKNPQGLTAMGGQAQMRRVALMFGTLEGLYDFGRVERRQDDNGAFVYFKKRAR